MTARAKFAAACSVLGWLMLTAGATWIFGPVALGAGGCALALYGVFGIDVDRDGS